MLADFVVCGFEVGTGLRAKNYVRAAVTLGVGEKDVVLSVWSTKALTKARGASFVLPFSLVP